MCGDALWRSLAALDAYRNRFEETPDSLTNPILLESLIVPAGPRPSSPQTRHLEDGTRRRGPAPSLGICRWRDVTLNASGRFSRCSVVWWT